MEDDDDDSFSDECEEFDAEIEVQLPPKKSLLPIDREAIMRDYVTGNRDEEEEAEFSGSEGDDSGSSSSDELEEKHDVDSVSTAVMLQEPSFDDEDEDDDIDDHKFSPKKAHAGVVLGDTTVLSAEVDRITADTGRI